jgi:hypothetical protein
MSLLVLVFGRRQKYPRHIQANLVCAIRQDNFVIA